MALHEVQLKGYSVRPGNLSLGTFDSYGIEQLHVTLDDTWSGLAVTATFNPPEGEPVEIRVPENGLIDVPAEATANEGTGAIVYCGVANGVQLITKTQGYNVITHANVGGTEPFNPGESLATQVLQAALNAEKNSAEAKDVADGLRNDAANGKFDGKDGAKGDKGDDGTTPQLKIGEDNLWNVSYDNGATWVSLGVKATGDAGKDGEDGVTPHIGENGNWWAGNTDTGVSAKGPAGERGPAGQPGPENLVIITATASTTVQNEYNPDTTYTKALADIQANKAVMIKLENVPGRYYIPYSSSNAEILASAGTVSGSKQSIELYLIKWTAQTNIITLTGTKEGCIADGGTAGQVLVKKSEESFDTEWETQYIIVRSNYAFNTANLLEQYKNGTLIYLYRENTNRLYTINYATGTSLTGTNDLVYTSNINRIAIQKCTIQSDNTISYYSENAFFLPSGGKTGQILAKKSNTNGDTEWIDPQTATVRTSMDDVALAGAKYILGEQAALSVTMPTDAHIGQEIMVVFSSGQTACTLAVNLDNFDFVPKANSMCKIVFLCVAADTWFVDAKER